MRRHVSTRSDLRPIFIPYYPDALRYSRLPAKVLRQWRRTERLRIYGYNKRNWVKLTELDALITELMQLKE